MPIQPTLSRPLTRVVPVSRRFALVLEHLSRARDRRERVLSHRRGLGFSNENYERSIVQRRTRAPAFQAAFEISDNERALVTDE